MIQIDRLKFKFSEEKKKVKYLKQEIKERDKRILKLLEDSKWLKEDHAELYKESEATDYLIGEIREFLGIDRDEKEMKKK